MNNFFKSLEPIVGQVDLQINLKAKGDLITCMVMPKSEIKDSAFSNIKPVFVTGTAEELDAEFLSAIINPLASAAGVINNIKSFEAGAQKLANENDAAKKQKEAEKKAKDERLKKYAALMGKADGFEKDNKLKDAIGALKQAKEFTDKPEAVDKRINGLMAKLTQGSMFDQSATAEEPATDYLADYKEEPAAPAEEETSDEDDDHNERGEE